MGKIDAVAELVHKFNDASEDEAKDVLQQLERAVAEVSPAGANLGRLCKAVCANMDVAELERWEDFLSMLTGRDFKADNGWVAIVESHRKDGARLSQLREEIGERARQVRNVAVQAVGAVNGIAANVGGGGVGGGGAPPEARRPKLPEFSGAADASCEDWWRAAKEVLVVCAVPERFWLGHVQQALKGDAHAEFWHVYESRKARNNNVAPSVDVVVADMVTVFDSGTGPRLLRQLLDLAQGNSTLLSYRAEFTMLMRRLHGKGVVFSEPMQAKLFAMTLSCSKLLAAKEYKNITEVVEQVRQLNLEEDEEVVANGDGPRALVAAHRVQAQGKARTCFRCGEVGHIAAHCVAPKPRQGRPAAPAVQPRQGRSAASEVHSLVAIAGGARAGARRGDSEALALLAA